MKDASKLVLLEGSSNLLFGGALITFKTTSGISSKYPVLYELFNLLSMAFLELAP